MEALRGVSLSVAPGELFGIIGPDGAGKTSLFRILTTLLLADGGSASVCGLDVVKDYKAIRRRVGYMPGRFSLYPDLTVEENLNFFATVFHTTIEENYDLVRDIYRQIEPFRKRRAGALSGGMKQKLALSCALIHKPDVLFLDEPTTGLDPLMRATFLNIIKEEHKKGKTILMSSHSFEELESTCDRVALINDGHIIDVCSMDEIHNREFKEFKIEFNTAEDYQRFIRERYEITRLQEQYSQATIKIRSTETGGLLHTLRNYNVKFISELPYSLERHFKTVLRNKKENEKNGK